MSSLHLSVLKKRISVLCRGDEKMSSKLFEAVQFAAQYNVYKDPYLEFNTPMLVVIGFFYALVRGDMELSKFMVSAAPAYPQLKSSWIKVWLRDDFNFEEEDVTEALTAVTVLINNGFVKVPMYFFEMFYSLGIKCEENVVIKLKASRTV